VPEPLPLVLFSGLGADARVLAPQQAAFPQLVVPRWLVPERRESLEHYCQRLADELKLEGPVYVGGISFGGIVAQYFARYVDAKACFLIGSLRGPRELPWRLRALGLFRSLLGVVPFSPLQRLAGWMATVWPFRKSVSLQHILIQIAGADPRVVRWSVEQLFKFEIQQLNVPVLRIHGSRDLLLPLDISAAQETVPEGGHLISVTHARQVNAFLRRGMQVSPPAKAPQR
jgi:pimeloyl-ACP methyl ester carboxylesterase